MCKYYVHVSRPTFFLSNNHGSNIILQGVFEVHLISSETKQLVRTPAEADPRSAVTLLQSDWPKIATTT